MLDSRKETRCGNPPSFVLCDDDDDDDDNDNDDGHHVNVKVVLLVIDWIYDFSGMVQSIVHVLPGK